MQPEELFSPSTAVNDHVQKRDLYEPHGVREYWLVHPTDRVVGVYRLDPVIGSEVILSVAWLVPDRLEPVTLNPP